MYSFEGSVLRVLSKLICEYTKSKKLIWTVRVKIFWNVAVLKMKPRPPNCFYISAITLVQPRCEPRDSFYSAAKSMMQNGAPLCPGKASQTQLIYCLFFHCKSTTAKDFQTFFHLFTSKGNCLFARSHVILMPLSDGNFHLTTGKLLLNCLAIIYFEKEEP